MGRNTVEVTSQQVNLALRGVMTQLEATGIAENFDGMAHALHELNLWDFVFNQAEVIATHWAWETMYTRNMHRAMGL